MIAEKKLKILHAKIKIVPLLVSLFLCQNAYSASNQLVKDQFEILFSNSQFESSDRLAAAKLKEVQGQANFEVPIVARSYLNAMRSATKWARWTDAIKLNSALAEGIKFRSENDVFRLEVAARGIELNTALAEFTVADHIYQQTLQNVVKNGLQTSPEFYLLLQAQEGSLRRQMRHWDRYLVLEKKLDWLNRFDPLNAVEIGTTLIKMSSVAKVFDRNPLRDKLLAQARPLIEAAYASQKSDRNIESRR
jgi:hypothetical protein